VTVTNERDKQTFQNWSAFGDPEETRLVAVTDADNKTWSYSYNALGSLTAVVPPSGAGRSWTYYGSETGGKPGLLKTETHPESGLVTTPTPRRTPQARSDPQFGQTSFGYDADDRLVSVNRPGTAYDTTMGWDASNNRTALANAYVSSTFSYDGANRLTGRTDAIGGRVFTTGFHPDANDNVAQIDYPAPSGLRVAYQFDAENRVSDVRQLGAPSAWAHGFSYHPSGVPASYTAGNGRVHTQTLTARQWPDVLASGVVGLDYGYDDVGNVTSIRDSVAGLTHGFTYDDVDRLETATGQWGAASFGYDPAGNRVSKTVAGATTIYA
jgi:YD repeat-containing protein